MLDYIKIGVDRYLKVDSILYFYVEKFKANEKSNIENVEIIQANKSEKFIVYFSVDFTEAAITSDEFDDREEIDNLINYILKYKKIIYNNNKNDSVNYNIDQSNITQSNHSNY